MTVLLHTELPTFCAIVIFNCDAKRQRLLSRALVFTNVIGSVNRLIVKLTKIKRWINGQFQHLFLIAISHHQIVFTDHWIDHAGLIKSRIREVTGGCLINHCITINCFWPNRICVNFRYMFADITTHCHFGRDLGWFCHVTCPINIAENHFACRRR